MNLSMRLTLDGLLRALRWRAHGAAEEIEAMRAEPAEQVRPAPRRLRPLTEEPDDQPRR